MWQQNTCVLFKYQSPPKPLKLLQFKGFGRLIPLTFHKSNPAKRFFRNFALHCSTGTGRSPFFSRTIFTRVTARGVASITVN